MSQVKLYEGEKICPECKGKGVVEELAESIFSLHNKICPTCNGFKKLDWIDEVRGHKTDYIPIDELLTDSDLEYGPYEIAQYLASDNEPKDPIKDTVWFDTVNQKHFHFNGNKWSEISLDEYQYYDDTKSPDYSEMYEEDEWDNL